MEPEQIAQNAAFPAAAEPASAPPAPARSKWIEFGGPRDFQWNRYELAISGLPSPLEGLRMVHLSDLHLRRRWPTVLDKLIARVRRESPDLVLITGDFVDNKRNHAVALPNVLRLVAGLEARLGCFGTLGNHDRYHLEGELAGSGVTIIEGRRQVVEAGGASIELIGLPGVHRMDLTERLLKGFPRPTPGVPRIVLSHFPDNLRRAASLRPDVYLAGHTHGGQVCLPGGWPLIRHDSLPRRLCSGVHRVEQTWLVVNRGLGYTDLPVRAFCPPEVIEITLTR